MQQTQNVSMLDITSNPTTFTFACTNYGHLSMLKQDWLRQQLLNAFPVAPEESGNSLEVNVTFAGPVHIGQYMRRVEMLIFQLRCNVDPFLSFEPSFRYA